MQDKTFPFCFIGERSKGQGTNWYTVASTVYQMVSKSLSHFTKGI